MKLRDVRAAVENVEAIFVLLGPSEEFLREFRERSRAIGRAVIREHEWTHEQAAEILTRPSSDEVVLGDGALVKFTEFKDWLAQQDLHSLSGRP